MVEGGRFSPSFQTVFTADQPMSRKTLDFRYVIPNAFADLSEFADAVPGEITDGRRCAG
jgi:hypothetical protein